jgi:hypothetical protein
MKLGDLFVFLIIAIILLVLSPILIPIYAYQLIKAKIEDIRFRHYLRSTEGKRYFCYTNRTTSQQYVRESILPFLPPDTEVIYITDKGFNLGDDTPFLPSIVTTLRRAPGGFPFATIVSNGRLVTRSFNNKLYSAIKRGINADTVNKKIRRFYDYNSTGGPKELNRLMRISKGS